MEQVRVCERLQSPQTKWYDSDVIGIDTGITLLMAENLSLWICLEHVHEERRGQARHAARGLQEIPTLTVRNPSQDFHTILPSSCEDISG